VLDDVLVELLGMLDDAVPVELLVDVSVPVILADGVALEVPDVVDG
jgi:hypothetical protein